jgi:hypothetical protein
MEIYFLVKKEVAPKTFLLEGHNALMAYAVPETDVPSDVLLEVGRTVCADTMVGTALGQPATVATKLRPVTAPSSHLQNAQTILDKLKAAGFGDMGIQDPAAWIIEKYVPLPYHLQQEWNSEKIILRRLLTQFQMFPTLDFQDDFQIPIDEMDRILNTLSVTGRINSERLMREANDYLNGLDASFESVEKTGIHLCGRLAEEANALLSACDDKRRFFQCDEYRFILITPEQHQALTSQCIFDKRSSN